MKCAHCGDTIKWKGVKLKSSSTGHTLFIVDQGCSLLLEARGVIELDGSTYKLMYG